MRFLTSVLSILSDPHPQTLPRAWLLRTGRPSAPTPRPNYAIIMEIYLLSAAKSRFMRYPQFDFEGFSGRSLLYVHARKISIGNKMTRTPRAASLDEATASIWMPFSEYVQRYFNAAQARTPEKMYHYTSAQAARSIASTGEIWLFNIFEAADQENRGAGSPDQKEVLSGIEIMCEEVDTVFSKTKDLDFRDFSDHFIRDMKTQHKNIARI